MTQPEATDLSLEGRLALIARFSRFCEDYGLRHANPSILFTMILNLAVLPHDEAVIVADRMIRLMRDDAPKRKNA